MITNVSERQCDARVKGQDLIYINKAVWIVNPIPLIFLRKVIQESFHTVQWPMI